MSKSTKQAALSIDLLGTGAMRVKSAGKPAPATPRSKAERKADESLEAAALAAEFAATEVPAVKEPGKVGRVAGACAQAWALYDSIADGLPVPRRMAVDLAIAEGINPATANTQFQRWVTARKAA